MKAIKFSVAAAAALAVSAFAADGDVLKPYGVISGEVGSYYGSGKDKDGNSIAARSYASRFGLTGAHALGALTAVYQVEVGFNATSDGGEKDKSGSIEGLSQDIGAVTGGGTGNNDGTLATRNTFVGVAGAFGTFLIGNHDTPYKIAARGVGAVSSADTVADIHLNTDRRLKSAVAYVAPAEALGGITLAAAVVPVRDVDTSSASKENDGFHYSLGVLAPIGDTGLSVGAGYESAYSPTVDESLSDYFVAATFKQDIFSVGLAFEVQDADDVVKKAIDANVAKSGLVAGANAAIDLANKHGLWSYTSVLVPVSVTLDDGIYINAAVRYTQYEDKYGDVKLDKDTLEALSKDGKGGEDELVFSASVGKKWGKDLDAYVGVKSVDNKGGFDLKKGTSGTDFGVGLKVAFN
jgi:hypothetical protein